MRTSLRSNPGFQQELAASPPFTRCDLTPRHVPRELQGTESEAAQGSFLNRWARRPLAVGMVSQVKMEASVRVPALVWLVDSQSSSEARHSSKWAPQV